MRTWTITQCFHQNIKLEATPSVKNLCQQDSEWVNKTTPGASSSGQLEAMEQRASGDRLLQKIFQVKRKVIFIQVLTERNTSGSSTILQRVSSRRLRWSTNCTIEYRTGFVQDLVNILPMFQISRTTLRFGAKLRTAVNGLHRGLQRITKTAKGWRWTQVSKDTIFDTVCTTTQRHIQHANLAGLEHISMVKSCVAEWSSSKIDQDESSRVLRFYILCWCLKSRSVQQLNWAIENWRIGEKEHGIAEKWILAAWELQFIRHVLPGVATIQIKTHIQKYLNGHTPESFDDRIMSMSMFSTTSNGQILVLPWACVKKYVVERTLQRTSRKIRYCRVADDMCKWHTSHPIFPATANISWRKRGSNDHLQRYIRQK